VHARVAGCAGESLEFLGCLFPQLQTFHVPLTRIADLLPAGLNGEVLLGQGNLGLARLAILGDQVAGEAGEMKIDHFTFAP
jgi:hypothetical protein